MMMRFNSPLQLIARPYRRYWLALPVILALYTLNAQLRAQEFSCVNGKFASADLGDGVSLQTCLWEKQPGMVVRTGPMQLIKNGILILQARTNLQGQLHGRYSSWDDDGKLMIRGRYDNGLKQGAWLFTDVRGRRHQIFYRQGVPARL